MIVQVLAVIGGDCGESVIGTEAFVPASQESTDEGIDKLHLSHVGLWEGVGAVVWGVGIDKVNP